MVYDEAFGRKLNGLEHEDAVFLVKQYDKIIHEVAECKRCDTCSKAASDAKYMADTLIYKAVGG